MSSRRFACLLLGVWLGGELLVAWVAAANRLSPERLLAQHQPLAAVRISDTGPAAERLLKYESAQQIRWLMGDWGVAQISLAVLVFGFLLFGSREGKQSLGLALMMFVAAIVQLILTPEVSDVTRALDVKTSGSLAGPLMVVNPTYWAVVVGKWAFGAWLAGKLILSPGRSRYPRQQFDLVNKRDYRHVDG